MNILLAINDSPYSTTAVEEVRRRPWSPGIIVRVLSAIEPITPPAAKLWIAVGGSFDGMAQEMKRQHEELTARAADSLRESGLIAESVVREGDPRPVIVDEAKDWPADLIVAGSHGYSGIKRWLLGSVAQSVVSHAPCSVEVVRQKLVEAV